jgi:ABC-type antimicrobial peptide transport system permease subunit
MILSDAAVLVVMGLAIGLSGSAALSTLIGGLLYGVSPADPFAHATVALVVVAVALIAAYLPARKAMGVDPMTALRTE